MSNPGSALCAVLQVLNEAGIGSENLVVIISAEIAIHRDQQLLRQRGFGAAKKHGSLVFDGHNTSKKKEPRTYEVWNIAMTSEQPLTQANESQNLEANP